MENCHSQIDQARQVTDNPGPPANRLLILTTAWRFLKSPGDRPDHDATLDPLFERLKGPDARQYASLGQTVTDTFKILGDKLLDLPQEHAWLRSRGIRSSHQCLV